MVRMEKILFPTDFSDFSSYAASFAVSFACDYGAKLHVLHVVDTLIDFYETLSETPPGEELDSKIIEMAAEELKAASSPEQFTRLDHESICIKGKPFVEIVRFARDKEMDMIVMGTHGRSAIEHALIGSTAERVVREARCPVFTVRKPGHRFVAPTLG